MIWPGDVDIEFQLSPFFNHSKGAFRLVIVAPSFAADFKLIDWMHIISWRLWMQFLKIHFPLFIHVSHVHSRRAWWYNSRVGLVFVASVHQLFVVVAHALFITSLGKFRVLFSEGSWSPHFFYILWSIKRPKKSAWYFVRAWVEHRCAVAERCIE